MSGDELQN